MNDYWTWKENTGEWRQYHGMAETAGTVYHFMDNKGIGEKSAQLRSKEHRPWDQTARVQALALVLGSYMTLLSLFNSVPQFSHL